jgi:diguanylate cyclase (GGDEF)-like protein
MNLLFGASVVWLRKFSGLIRRQAPLFIGAGVLVGCISTGMAALDVYLHDILIEQGSRTARNFSYILSDQTDRSLRSVSSAVSSVVDSLQAKGPDSVVALEAAARTNEIQAKLRDRVSADPFLDSLFIVGSDGKMSDPASDLAISIADLRGQRYLDSLRDARPDAVYVSLPFRSRINGTWQLGVAKRVSASNGFFLGIVGGVVKLASFQALLEKVALGTHGSISIFRDDGSIIACFPQREIAFGSDIASSGFYSRFIATKPEGVTLHSSDVDGVDRMFAFVRSPDFPVVSVVAMAMSDVLADWRRQVELLALGAGAIVLAIVFGAVRLAVHVEQLAEARQREAVQAQAAIQHKQFNNAMDNIVQGLAMYDQENRLIACNKRYAEIYRLPKELTMPGVSRDRILAYRSDHGFGKVSSDPRKEPDGSILLINELKDGRIIAQRKKQLPEGGWVSTHEDITLRRRAEDQVKEMATRDALTGLSNRFEFKQRLERYLAEVWRPNGKFAVLYLDLDHFKAVNDAMGHTAGDELLQEVSTRIRATVRQSDIVARLGGDEFAIVQGFTYVPAVVERLAQQLIASIREPFTIAGKRIEMGASVGISLAPEDGVEADELIRKADMALYHSKMNRGGYTFFEPWMDERVRVHRQLGNDLRTALAAKQFELFFQPTVSVSDREVVSFEALLRWKHPERGYVPPSEFIPLAEENGMIVPMGGWVLREACREAAKWPSHIKVAINVSVVQFKSPGLLVSISEAIRVAGLEGSRVIVEVTESVMLKDDEKTISTLHSIREMGIAVAMDDFGTGYSSLSYLRRFPFDKIKIDKSFVAELGKRDDSAAIVRAATGLAKALGMVAVAEGIETELQMAQIAIEGCSEAQGYLISRPMPAQEVFRFLGVEPLEVVSRPAVTPLPQGAGAWQTRLPVVPSELRNRA